MHFLEALLYFAVSSSIDIVATKTTVLVELRPTLDWLCLTASCQERGSWPTKAHPTGRTEPDSLNKGLIPVSAPQSTRCFDSIAYS